MSRLVSMQRGTDGEDLTSPAAQERELLRRQHYAGRIGDKASYWSNPIFTTPAAFLGFEIPVTSEIQLLSGFHRANTNNNVLVYSEKHSVLVVPEEPVEKPAEVSESKVPSFPIRCQFTIGKSVKTMDTNLREVLLNQDWKGSVQKMAAQLAPKLQRTVATQTIETRLTVVPEPGCLRCKKHGHTFQKCTNDFSGDPYCTNCRRIGHTNNNCPYQPWRAVGYEAVRRYCRSCKAQYPFINDACSECCTRGKLTNAAKGAYLILPP
ncbi:hypothetical protein KQX54_013012 [Cotesia glomerata]|uniref:CCHC-type domain-containing protein n=1 Tax=Cotesia glomerata TaxID=32391 RepID=A0AAV7HVA1_COTGL|nr:hypothetical protein KQX54_013012 [Cotesia glomerata]